MAVNTLERSAFSGRPLQLYRFLRSSNGVDHYWRYNGADRDLTYLGDVYSAVSISDEGIRLTGEAASSEFQITLPAFAHMLYDPATCKVDKADFRVDGTVVAAHGQIVTCDEFAGFADGWFTGGFIEYLLPTGFLETRMINRHLGASVRVLSPVLGMAAGDPVVAYPGCKRTVRACIDKFNNYDNYGGFPHIPGRSPYDGQPVF
jgi:hypothetical protein